jgi:hypothetical protein
MRKLQLENIGVEIRGCVVDENYLEVDPAGFFIDRADTAECQPGCIEVDNNY